MCRSPANDDFIRALENNTIPNVNISRREVKIAKGMFGYLEHAAKGKMKHSRKGVQMNSNTDYFLLVPKLILEHY